MPKFGAVKSPVKLDVSHKQPSSKPAKKDHVKA